MRARWDAQDLRVVQDAVKSAFVDLGTSAQRQTALGVDFLDWALDSDGFVPPEGDSPSGLPYVFGSIGLLDSLTFAHRQCDTPARRPEYAFELTSQGPLTIDAREAIMDVVEDGLIGLPNGYWADFDTFQPPTGQPAKLEEPAGYYAILHRIRIHASP